jgi:rare lipoprotein A
MEQFVAAHRTLPFQTWIEVTNLDNGKKVDVRIIDRGPFTEHRILDLSRAAAREIGLLQTGTAKVELRVIEPPKHPPSPPSSFTGGFTVQAGAFRDRDRADALRASLLKARESKLSDARLSPTSANPPLWRVWVGKNLTPEEAERLASQVKAVAGQALVVHEGE